MTKQSILITGASDGLGKALAYEMAERGYNLALSARRAEKLEAIKDDLGKKHPQQRVETAVLDVNDLSAVRPCLEELQRKLGQLDIVMVNAGIAYAGVLGKSELDLHQGVIDTNVSGALATIDAALRIFRAQGSGHLVGTSSVAAYRGMPRNAAYCASKAALTTLLEAVRAETMKENISVTVLHPGYIDTDINRALKSRPFLIDAAKGARIMANLIEKKVKRSTVPVWPWCLVAPLLARLPDKVVAGL